MNSYIGYWKGSKEAVVLKSIENELLQIYIIGNEKPILTTVKSFDKWCIMNNAVQVKGKKLPKASAGTTAWKKGQKAELANKVGISKQFLADIINRRSRAPIDTAEKIEKELEDMGIESSAIDWISSKETDSPLFAPL